MMLYHSLPLIGSIFVMILISEGLPVNRHVGSFILLLIVIVGLMSNVLRAFLKVVFCFVLFCYFCICNVPINNNHINQKVLVFAFEKLKL